MLTTEQINDLHRLYCSDHWPIRKIERHLHMGWDTIKKYLDMPASTCAKFVRSCSRNVREERPATTRPGRLSFRISASLPTSTLRSPVCSPGMRIRGIDRASPPRRKAETFHAAPPPLTSTPQMSGVVGQALRYSRLSSLDAQPRPPGWGHLVVWRQPVNLDFVNATPCPAIHPLNSVATCSREIRIRSGRSARIRSHAADPNRRRATPHSASCWRSPARWSAGAAAFRLANGAQSLGRPH